MINADMRTYDYFTFGDSSGYGQPQLSNEVKGSVKMAINLTSQAVQENINYKDASYVGLTHCAVNDKMVIKYENTLLKVLYVNPKGRLKQVFLSEYQH